MKRYESVQCLVKPEPIELQCGTLYINSNIRKMYDEDCQKDFYVYNQEQYCGDEIIEYLNEKLIGSEQLLTELELNQFETNQTLTEIDLKILELEVNAHGIK